MKKLDFKSIIVGLIIGIISAGVVSASQIEIKSALYNETKVIYNGEEIPLSQPMITVVNEGSQNGSNYMPVRNILEEMGYEVGWDAKNNSVIIEGYKEEIINLDNQTESNISQDDVDSFKDLFDIGELQYNDPPKVYTKTFTYKQVINNEDFNTLLTNYPNRDSIMKSILNEITTEKPYLIYVVFYINNGENLVRMGHYIKHVNGKIEHNLR